jgi:RecB family endonuclease NucS
LRDNWPTTTLAEEWQLYAEEGEPEAGFEYPVKVGYIDLLAQHREEDRWLVIELKRDQGSDRTVGQVLRYMGAVRRELAEEDDAVEGLIIAHKATDRLRYAVSEVSSIDLQLYDVDFHLHPDSTHA